MLSLQQYSRSCQFAPAPASLQLAGINTRSRLPIAIGMQLVGINTLLSFREHQHPSVIPHFFVIPQRRNPQPKQ